MEVQENLLKIVRGMAAEEQIPLRKEATRIRKQVPDKQLASP